MRDGASRRINSIVAEEGGFTLLELLAVCALIALMLSLAIPNLRALYHADPLSRSARLVERAVERARTKAIESDQPVPVTIDIAAHRVAVGQDQSGFSADLPEASAITSVQVGSVPAEGSGSIVAWVNERGMIEPLELVIRGETREVHLSFSPFVAPRITEHTGLAGTRSPASPASGARIN